MLESYLRAQRKKKDILLMTHVVLGYPSFKKGFRIIEAMVEAGVDLIELQIPFSEPIADGPVILRANQMALAGGTRVAECIEFGQEVAGAFDIPFLFMSYYNILFKYGLDRFADTMDRAGLKGAIVPDLPPEEGEEYLGVMAAHRLAPIFIYSPNTPESRLKSIASHSKGFIYCVARKGVTGGDTDFAGDLEAYIQRCRRATDLPLALGCGVKETRDVDFLKGKVDIAVIGTQTIRLVEKEGVESIGMFIKSLR